MLDRTMATDTVDRLRVTMRQMARMIRVLEDLKKTVLPKNPQLFAALSESPLEELDRLGHELNGYLDEIAATVPRSEIVAG